MSFKKDLFYVVATYAAISLIDGKRIQHKTDKFYWDCIMESQEHFLKTGVKAVSKGIISIGCDYVYY